MAWVYNLCIPLRPAGRATPEEQGGMNECTFVHAVWWRLCNMAG